jgi:hypothetical protein
LACDPRPCGRIAGFAPTLEPTVKALFFLRHYNDIDHITPVIHKWAEQGHGCDVVLIGEGHFAGDYRIRYLSSLRSVRLAHIDQILSRCQVNRLRVQKLLLHRYFTRIAPAWLTRVLGHFFDPQQRSDFWLSITQTLLQRSFAAGEPGVVAFDWISSHSVLPVEFVQQVVRSARARGLGTVSLPHGDSPHANLLVRVDELRIAPQKKFAAAGIFDVVVVPNELCASRYRPFLPDSSIAVLGSARYCDEWLAKLEGLLPPSPLAADPGKLKLVMFLRKRDFSIFWDEVRRVIELLANFPEVELIVKAHTRGGWRQPLSRDLALRRRQNVRFVAAEIHSGHLLDWADAVIDIATSVAFESVKKQQPVLAADYLHAGISTVGKYLPESVLNCRDDVYAKVRQLLDQGCGAYYVPEHRQRFLDEIIDVPDADVLPRYVHLLETLASSGKR